MSRCSLLIATCCLQFCFIWSSSYANQVEATFADKVELIDAINRLVSQEADELKQFEKIVGPFNPMLVDFDPKSGQFLYITDKQGGKNADQVFRTLIRKCDLAQNVGQAKADAIAGTARVVASGPRIARIAKEIGYTTSCIDVTYELAMDLAMACYRCRRYEDAAFLARLAAYRDGQAAAYFLKGVSEVWINQSDEAKESAKALNEAVKAGKIVGLSAIGERVNGPRAIRFSDLIARERGGRS